MATSFTITLDSAALHEALEGESLKTYIRGFVKAAAKISADHIGAEAIARLQRQLSGTSSGRTLAGIVVKPLRSGWGFIVDAGNLTQPMLDVWLEKGTKHMAARPFFYDAARLEQQAHTDRVGTAIQVALSEYGLGDALSRTT